MVKLALLITLLISFAKLSYAASVDCENAKAWHETEVCSSQETKAMDTAINDLFAELQLSLPEEQRELLISEQRQWLTRAKNCESILKSYDAQGQGASEASWCLFDTLRWRKVQLTIAKDNNDYLAYRSDPSCQKLGDEQHLQCLIKDLEPTVIDYGAKGTVKIYDYPYQGQGTSMLLPGKEGKTYIVDVNGKLTSASEIYADNSQYKNNSRIVPVFVTKRIVQLDVRIDGCGSKRMGVCDVLEELFLYRLDKPDSEPEFISQRKGYFNRLSIGALTTVNLFVEEQATAWDPKLATLTTKANWYLGGEDFIIEFQTRPSGVAWATTLSPVYD